MTKQEMINRMEELANNQEFIAMVANAQTTLEIIHAFDTVGIELTEQDAALCLKIGREANSVEDAKKILSDSGIAVAENDDELSEEDLEAVAGGRGGWFVKALFFGVLIGGAASSLALGVAIFVVAADYYRKNKK